MKRTRSALVLALAWAMLGGAALAQEQGPRRGRRGDGEGFRAGRRGGAAVEGRGPREGRPGRPGRQGQQERPLQRLQRVLRQLNLTAEQREKVAAILAEYNAPAQEARQAMQAARRSGDQQAMQAARRKMRELQQQRQGPPRELIRKIAAVLTKTQRERFLYLMGPGGRLEELLGALRSLELEPVQRRQIRDIAAQAKAEARMKTEPERKAKIFAEAQEKIMALLTDEQKARLRRLMAARARGTQRAAVLEALNLTAEQQAAVEAIQAEMRKKIEAAETPEARREAMREARAESMRRIFTEVLTEQQQQQFREQMQQRRRRRGPGGGPGAGGEGGPRGGGRRREGRREGDGGGDAE